MFQHGNRVSNKGDNTLSVMPAIHGQGVQTLAAPLEWFRRTAFEDILGWIANSPTCCGGSGATLQRTFAILMNFAMNNQDSIP